MVGPTATATTSIKDSIRFDEVREGPDGFRGGPDELREDHDEVREDRMGNSGPENHISFLLRFPWNHLQTLT